MQAMKKILSVFFLGISLCLVAQGSDLKDAEQIDSSGLSIGIHASPDLAYRALFNMDGSNSSDIVISSRNGYESLKFSFTAGAVIGWRLNKKFRLESGLNYSNMGFELDFDKLPFTFSPEISDRNGLPYVSGPVDLRIPYRNRKHLHYLEIPLKVFYRKEWRRWAIVSGLGISGGWLMLANETLLYRDANGDKDRSTRLSATDFKAFNVFALVSAGAEYRFSPRFSLRMEPSFRYGMIPISNTPVSAGLWNVGLSSAFFYHIP
jgi:hypothetical protein